MNKIALLFTLLITLNIQAQRKTKSDEYYASNGITYKVGDEIKLGRGSDTNGKFIYVTQSGWMKSSSPEENRLQASSAGIIVTIKKSNNSIPDEIKMSTSLLELEI